MPKPTAQAIRQATGLDLYDASVTDAAVGVTLFLARRGGEKFFGHIPPADGALCQAGCNKRNEPVGDIDGRRVCLEPADAAAAGKLRKLLPWTRPKCLHLATSAGLGDRLGLATPGHVRAVRGSGLACVLAQQSIREMTRTDRNPQQVMDDAAWGVFQEGFTDGFGADADHLQKPEDIDATVAAGFTMFTIDPGAHVDNAADADDAHALADKVGRLPMADLDTRAADLTSRYVGKRLDLDGATIAFDEITLLRAAAKYGRAVAHAAAMHRHLQAVATGPVELEISVDETDSPTTPAEHYFFAAELKRLGVTWVSMAPRFVGRFEKGVDYIGDLDAFAASFAEHVAVMKALGPYKMSIHSGSDKFSIYPIVADLAGPYVHLKTAGTSYLEALRAVAGIEPGLFRAILDFARGRYDQDKATYHVSADVAKVPAAETFKDADLAGLLDQFDARQVLHVTYGSVLTADGGRKFRAPLLAALKADEQAHYAVLERHLGRHLAPLAK